MTNPHSNRSRKFLPRDVTDQHRKISHVRSNCHHGNGELQRNVFNVHTFVHWHVAEWENQLLSEKVHYSLGINAKSGYTFNKIPGWSTRRIAIRGVSAASELNWDILLFLFAKFTSHCWFLCCSLCLGSRYCQSQCLHSTHTPTKGRTADYKRSQKLMGYSAILFKIYSLDLILRLRSELIQISVMDLCRNSVRSISAINPFEIKICSRENRKKLHKRTQWLEPVTLICRNRTKFADIGGSKKNRNKVCSLYWTRSR